MENVETVEVVDGIKVVDPTKHMGKVGAVAFLGFGIDGVDMVVAALALPLIMKEWGLTLVEGGFIMTAMLLGASMGGYIFGPIADKFGRRKGLAWCIGFFSITTALAALAQDQMQLSALRFIAGLGLGAEWALGSTMLAEFFPAEKRGKASSLMMMGWPVGYLVALALQSWLVPMFGWRGLFAAGSIGVLLSAYIWFFIPESPVWLLAQAKKKLGTDNKVPIAATKMTDLFKPAHMKTTICATVILMSALMAYWALNAWLPTLLVKDKGLPVKEMIFALVIFQFGNIAGFLIGFFMGGKVAKRPIIMISGIGSAIMLGVWMGLPTGLNTFLVLGALYHCIGSIFWSMLPAFIAEQFPTNIRAFGAGFSYSTGRFVATLSPMVLAALTTQTKLGFSQSMAMTGAFYALAAFMVFLMREKKVLET